MFPPGKMEKILAKAQKAQAKMQEDIAALRVEGSSGGGIVKALVDGNKNVLDLVLSPEALEDADASEVADLVLAAISDAQRTAQAEVEKKMSDLAGMLGLPPGMGL
ncbi:MAG: YbaB/EbfC family nucleoid-associated protein [Acidobacteriota bacterium]|nr:YbaB/EbfC family nucleoid-associated protein [Acidobacteriota bacterium]MDQ7088399.1 YbaB/EbfC family nucleoid-associated protein [Acidobacteriota bacterium]